MSVTMISKTTGVVIGASGTKYTADGQGLISVSVASDVASLLNAGCTFPTGQPLSGVAQTPIAASGAVSPSVSANYIITKAGVAVITLAAPAVGTADGLIIEIASSTLYAHTLTATGLLNTGTASVNLATFAAYAGAGLRLQAYQGLWNVLGSVCITFS